MQSNQLHQKPDSSNVTENDGVLRSNRPGESKNPSLSFSVSLQERVLAILPDKPVKLVAWKKSPPRDSANFALWRLARLLKWDEETVRFGVQRFMKLVHTFAGDMEVPPDDAWDIFTDAYKRAKVPLSDGLLAKAKLNAETEPFDCEGFYLDPLRCSLLSCCWQLSKLSDDGVFFLGCRDAGHMAGTDHATASRWLRSFVRDKFLEVHADGDAYHATRYRWKGRA